jgi:hypothetical protein
MKKVILGLIVVSLVSCHSASTEVVISDSTSIKIDSVIIKDSVKLDSIKSK